MSKWISRKRLPANLSGGVAKLASERVTDMGDTLIAVRSSDGREIIRQ